MTETIEPGSIIREHVALCGAKFSSCVISTRNYASRMRGAEKNFRQLGWRNTTKYGWTCGSCLSVLEARKLKDNSNLSN